nr:MAG TPA: protein of unknown function (DUF4494) [Caudoviricetes sp.]
MRTRTANWFETKIKYRRTMEDGSEKVVSELYVVDALTCTEAENKVIDEMSAYSSGENKVTRTSEAAFSEVFFSDNDEDDKWYKAKLQFITLDEKTEKERRTNVTYLVQAKSLARALRYIDDVMGKTMIDYDTIGLNETKVMDVFEHSSPSDKNKNDNE